MNNSLKGKVLRKMLAKTLSRVIGHDEPAEASLPLRLEVFKEAVEMLRQVQQDQGLQQPSC
jgi:hypothetical protein